MVASGGSSLPGEIRRFTGQSSLSLDDKGRLVVPARYRDDLGTTFVVAAAAADPCLVLYPQSRWALILQRLDEAPRKDSAYRRFRRHFLAQAEDASCDAQGRLVIPPHLRAKAELEREAVCVGANTHLEIWNPEKLAASEPAAFENEQFAAELGVD